VTAATSGALRLPGHHGSLFLVGLRGAGKSSIAAAAAPLAGLRCVDTDQEVERRAGRAIADIFARDGEAAFRQLEREIMLELLRQEGLLVATGGGSVLDEEVRDRLRRTGTAVWLDATVADLAGRVRAGDRPSLTGAPVDEEIGSLAALRRPLYAACTAARIETSGRTIADAAAELARLWHARAAPPGARRGSRIAGPAG
jgi:shikimate kinase